MKAVWKITFDSKYKPELFSDWTHINVERHYRKERKYQCHASKTSYRNTLMRIHIV